MAAGKPDDQLKEQMNSSIRMETDDEPAPAARTVGGELSGSILSQGLNQSWARKVSSHKNFFWQHLGPNGRSGGLQLEVDYDNNDVVNPEVGKHYICLKLKEKKPRQVGN